MELLSFTEVPFNAGIYLQFIIGYAVCGFRIADFGLRIVDLGMRILRYFRPTDIQPSKHFLNVNFLMKIVHNFGIMMT